MNKLKELPSVDELQEMAAKAHAINVKNGFWEKPRDTDDLVWLMKSEGSESGECYRKGRVMDEELWSAYLTLDQEKLMICGDEEKEERAKTKFKTFYKETIEMEIADIIIRVMDCMMGFDIPFLPLKEVEVDDKDSLKVFIRIDKLLHPLYDTVMNKEAANHFAVVLCYLFSYDENMAEYVRVKTIYNSTRGFMHGGKKA